MTVVTSLGLLALLAVLTLLVTSLLLVYPVVRYASNVAHTAGLVALSAAFLLLTVAAVDGFLFGRSVRVSAAVLFASLAALVGTVSFARPFLALPAWSSASSDDPEPAAFEDGFGGGGDR